MLHDTHAHLEMLLEKLDILTLSDREDFNPKYSYDFPHSVLDDLLKYHEFIVQATTSTKNFLLVHKLFSYNPKIKFLIGSHPEIVDERFVVKDYLNEQKELLLEYGFLVSSPAGELELVSTYGSNEFLEGRGISKLEQSFRGAKILGLGECGLDYHYTQDKEIIRKQWDLFESQISLAAYLDTPLVIHTRDSIADTLAIVQKFPQMKDKFLFHCFSGNLSELEQVLQLGGYISVGGVLTFKNAQQLRDVVQACPLDRLLVETDLPFLAPTPHRGKTCLPEYVDLVTETITQVKKASTMVIWEKLKKNSLQFFKKVL